MDSGVCLNVNIPKVIKGTSIKGIKVSRQANANWEEEFEERKLNAFYKDGTLHISNAQDDEEDMYDDIVHEIAHSIETALGYVIYGDEKIKNEFLRKRKYLHDIKFLIKKLLFRHTPEL